MKQPTIEKEVPEYSPKVLIVRTDRIGDVVLTLPLAERIKQELPDVHVSFLVRRYTAPLAEQNEFIDSVFIYPDDSGDESLRELEAALREEKFDAAILVYPTFTLARILRRAGIPVRIGTGYRWYSFLLTHRLYEHRKKSQLHEIEHNFHLLRFLEIDTEITPSRVVYGITPDDAALIRVRKLLASRGVPESEPLVILHPGSGGSSEDLPENRWCELIEQLHSSGKATIFVTGSEQEIPLCERLKNHAAPKSSPAIYTEDADNQETISQTGRFSRQILQVAGLFDLKEFIALISLSRVVIANSTGPLHIAAALGKNVIGFFPKRVECSATRWGPYTTRGNVFTPTIACTSCTREQCAKLQCMNSIDVHAAVQRALEHLSRIERIIDDSFFDDSLISKTSTEIV